MTQATIAPHRAGLRLSDEVIARLAQIFQEAMLTQTDCVDHMRLLRLQASAASPDALVPTPEYMKWVNDEYARLATEGERLRAADKKRKPAHA